MFVRVGLFEICRIHNVCGSTLISIQTLKIHQYSLLCQARVRVKSKTSSNRQHIPALPEKYRDKVPLISCKRVELNHYTTQRYDKFAEIPFASKGWHHRQAKGDYFTINIHENNSLPSVGQDTDHVLFRDLGIGDKIVQTLRDQGITEPTTIQALGIPTILSGCNTLLAAETGCGKTLAYLLPLLCQAAQWRDLPRSVDFNSPVGLVVTPSRELAHQIGEVAYGFDDKLGIETKVLIGGRTKQKMVNPSFDRVDILVATLGALSKLTTTGIYNMSHVHHVILDEADTLLDDSFSEKLLYFLRRFPFQFSGPKSLRERPMGTQLTLVSATMPTSLPETLSQIIVPESLKRVTTEGLHRLLPHVPQKFLRLNRTTKPTTLLKLLKADHEASIPAIIFSNKSSTCDWISMFLCENGVPCVNLHGDLPINIRNGRLRQFKEGFVSVISCTDIGSRGLDTTMAQHVVNYDFPLHMADYIHRCGRTGRIGSPAHSHVTNFVAGQLEVDLVQKIELAARKMDVLPNVNANITQVLRSRMLKKMEKSDAL